MSLYDSYNLDSYKKDYSYKGRWDGGAKTFTEKKTGRTLPEEKQGGAEKFYGKNMYNSYEFYTLYASAWLPLGNMK